MVASGVALIQKINQENLNVISTACKSVMPGLSDEQAQKLDFVYSLIAFNPNIVSFQIILSAIVIQHCINILSMLRRTSAVGPSIIMMVSLKADLAKFFSAFSLPLVAFVLIGYYMNEKFTEDNLGLYLITQ